MMNLKFSFRIIVLSLFVAPVLIGCQTTSPLLVSNSPLSDGINRENARLDDEHLRKENSSEQISPAIKTISAVKQSVQQASRYQPSTLSLKLSDKKIISIAVDDMPTTKFLHYVLGELLKTNYVFDESELGDKQNLTLNIAKKISASELLALTLELLSNNNITISEKKGVLFVHKKLSGQNNKIMGFGIGKQLKDVPEGVDEVFQMITLSYTEISRLSQIMSQMSKVKFWPDKLNNSVILRGNRSEVVKAMAIVNMLDVPSLKGKYIGMIKLIYLPAIEFIEGVSTLLKKEGFSVGSSATIDGAISFTAIEHLNAVVVHSVSNELLDRAFSWAKQIDQVGASDQKMYNLYKPAYSRAKDLAVTIQSVLALKTRGNTLGQSTNRANSNTNKNIGSTSQGQNRET